MAAGGGDASAGGGENEGSAFSSTLGLSSSESMEMRGAGEPPGGPTRSSAGNSSFFTCWDEVGRCGPGFKAAGISSFFVSSSSSSSGSSQSEDELMSELLRERRASSWLTKV